jgi:hypothetical protein
MGITELSEEFKWTLSGVLNPPNRAFRLTDPTLAVLQSRRTVAT